VVVPDAGVWLHQLAQLAARFAAAARRALRGEQARLEALLRRLQQAHPGARLLQHSQRLDELEARLRLAMRSRLAASAARLDGAARALQAVSPLATLGRGFAVVTRASDGALVTDAQQLAVGEIFDARLAAGGVRAAVLERRS
jgi:exodeoxyribonuclease VII large subunit